MPRYWRITFHSTQVRLLTRSSRDSGSMATKSGFSRMLGPSWNHASAAPPFSGMYSTAKSLSASTAREAMILSLLEMALLLRSVSSSMAPTTRDWAAVQRACCELSEPWRTAPRAWRQIRTMMLVGSRNQNT